ncbi:MAG: RDD family protein [Planctomycetia bacterium]|nr:RDD family protein [Planctomycetia bacterium]
MEFAGFWRRVVAYLLDIVPITLAVALAFYVFYGFDETLSRYLNRPPGDLDARRQFLVERNQIRNVALGLYLLYCGFIEASPLRATVGKWLVGIEVLDMNGQRLTYPQAAKRNSGKALSFLVFGLGCLWVAWSREKRGWHDYLAGTCVRVRRTDTEVPARLTGDTADFPAHGSTAT